MINIIIICNDLNNMIILTENIRRCLDTSTCIISTSDPQEAYEIIRKRKITFDMFIIDMQQEKISGNVIEGKIRNYYAYKNTPILFIIKDSYNLKGYQHLSTYQTYKRNNYISLPLDKLDIQAKVSLYLEPIIKEQMKNDSRNKILDLEGENGLRRVPVKEILFLEIQNKICTVYCKKAKYLIKRTSLLQAIRWINSDDIIRCHRFFAINVNNVDYIQKNNERVWNAYFKDSNYICPISKVYFNKVIPYLNT